VDKLYQLIASHCKLVERSLILIAEKTIDTGDMLAGITSPYKETMETAEHRDTAARSMAGGREAKATMARFKVEIQDLVH
jgi:hypothetical protein